MNVIKSILSPSFIAAAAVLAGMPVQAAPDCGSVTSVERRIVEHANGDVGALRSFVGITAVIHGINMVDVQDNLDKWRATLVCRDQVAAAERAAQTAAAQPAGKADEALVSQR